MATNYVRYVDVDADAGGDGTTAGLTGATCAFKSLSLAEAAGGGASQPPLDLAAASDTYRIVCGSAHASHTADTTQAMFNGWTTNATSYVTVEAAAASWAGTAWSESKYRLVTTTGNSLTTNGCNYFRALGLQVKAAAVAIYYQHSTGVIDSCFAWSTSTGAIQAILIWAAGTHHVINTIAIAPSGTLGEALRVAETNANVYSCTLIGSKYGLRRVISGTMVTKNCYARGATAAYDGTMTQTKCASSDTTGSEAGLRNIAYSTAQFVSVTAGAEDLTLVSGSALIDVGTDTSGEGAPLNFTDDILGTTRATWDIGAHEYVAAPSFLAAWATPARNSRIIGGGL